jgi:CrcB protein
MDGLVGHLTEVLPHDPMIESGSASRCSCTAARQVILGGLVVLGTLPLVVGLLVVLYKRGTESSKERPMADEQTDEPRNGAAARAAPRDGKSDRHVSRQGAQLAGHRLDVLGVIAVGGMAGADARYGLGLVLPHRTGDWPWATLLINISGCFLIGVLMIIITEVRQAHRLVRPCLGVGVLGGYTTFSTYAVDALSMARADRFGLALGYLILTPVLAVLACAVGAGVTRFIGVPRGHRVHPQRRTGR